MNEVKVVMLDYPQSLLDERQRLGNDVFDECWEGVLHLVNPPSNDHQNIGGDLQGILWPVARRLGLRTSQEKGYFAADDDWRVPDLVVASDDACSDRGVEGPAALVVEIRSPHDETDAKLAWYAERGAAEIVVIDPDTRTAELYVNRDGDLVLVSPDADGTVRSSLGVSFRTVEGPHLEVTTEHDTVTI